MDRVSHQRRVNAGSERRRYSARRNVSYPVDYHGNTTAFRPGSGEAAGRAVSGRVARNRAKALRTDAGFVIFLAFAVTILVLVCVKYLNLKATLSAGISENETLESNLTTLQSENDALLESVNNSVDWFAIRDKAVNEFSMDYADEDQIVWYNGGDTSNVKQYLDVQS